MSVYVQPCQYELIKLKTNIVRLRCCQTIIQSKLDSTCATVFLHVLYISLLLRLSEKGFQCGKKTNVSRYPHLLHVYLYNIIYKNTQWKAIKSEIMLNSIMDHTKKECDKISSKIKLSPLKRKIPLKQTSIFSHLNWGLRD